MNVINGIEVELHRKLFEDDNKYSSYFRDVFKHATHKDGHTYVLENEFHFCYILVHYIKHLVSGAGLRELCDVYIMLEKLDLDMNKVNEFLDEYKLKEFFNTVLNELNILFDYDKLSFTKNEAAHDLINYSIESGIHGFGENGDKFGNMVNNSSDSKIKIIVKRLFIPVKEMFTKYKWTKSIVLLPLGYVVRFFHLIINRRYLLKKVIDSKDNRLFAKIGLEDYK